MNGPKNTKQLRLKTEDGYIHAFGRPEMLEAIKRIAQEIRQEKLAAKTNEKDTDTL